MNLFFPVEHDSAEKWLDDFLRKRLDLFGEYEDSISTQNAYLYHSLLSPLLNIGLLILHRLQTNFLNLPADGMPL